MTIDKNACCQFNVSHNNRCKLNIKMYMVIYHFFNLLRCSDGFLKLYLRGQDINHLYDKYDADLCGNNATAVHWSEGPRLAMIFSSGQTQGSGFKCKYQFATGMLLNSF